MNTITSRRAVLAGAAALPALTAPAALAAAASDPIFAALARCRRIEDAAEAASHSGDEKLYDEASNGMREAREALALTVPTTLDGLAAVTAFAVEMSERLGEPYFCDELGDHMNSEAMDFVRSVAKAARALMVLS